MNQILLDADVHQDVVKWLSEHSLGVSAWGLLSYIFAQINTSPNSVIQMMTSSLADVTVIFSFVIAVLTVLIKIKEFITAYFKKAKKKQQLTKEDE